MTKRFNVDGFNMATISSAAMFMFNVASQSSNSHDVGDQEVRGRLLSVTMTSQGMKQTAFLNMFVGTQKIRCIDNGDRIVLGSSR
jgi:hypothetical protein